MPRDLASAGSSTPFTHRRKSSVLDASRRSRPAPGDASDVKTDSSSLPRSAHHAHAPPSNASSCDGPPGRWAGPRPAIKHRARRSEAPLVGVVAEARLHLEIAGGHVADRGVDGVTPWELLVERLGGGAPESLALVLGQDSKVDGDHH